MSAIGQVQASLAAASHETTQALANLNFDFSLVKVEAPPEYQQLGTALANERRSAAESGSAHQTARRLGSLFQSVLPDTPNLVRAYGKRASEIAQCPEVNPKGTRDDGPFQRYIGADGTTIWAAATSGTAAIAAHLLACMLAVHWPATEAVAIWIELVDERKKRLAATAANDGSRIDDSAASLLSIDRTQLAMWDASARSWLKAAEDAPMVKTRQSNFRSTLGDMNATVDGKEDLYTSVLDAWVLTMETFESIVSGSSFSVQDGAVVLGLLSWHLYPDIVVLGQKSRELPQDDSLISSGGLVTIGLSSQRTKKRITPGIHWSLALAHLTYYGTPQVVKRSIGPEDVENNRLTLDEFSLVLLGAFAALWGEAESISAASAIDIIGLIVGELKRGLDDPVMKKEMFRPERCAFVDHLAAAVARYQGSDTDDSRNGPDKLVQLGFKNKAFFKHGSTTGFRSFGLDGIPLGALFERHEDRLAYYRSIAGKLVTVSQRKSEDDTRCLLLISNEGKEDQKAFFYCKPATRSVGSQPLSVHDDVDEVRVGLKSYTLLFEEVDVFHKGRGRKVPKKVAGLTWKHTPAWIKTVLSRCDVMCASFVHPSSPSPSMEWVFDCIHTTSNNEFLLFRGRATFHQTFYSGPPPPLDDNYRGRPDPGFQPINRHGPKPPPGPGPTLLGCRAGPPPPPPPLPPPGAFGGPPPPGIQPTMYVPPPRQGLPRVYPSHQQVLDFEHTHDEIKAAFQSGRVSPVRLSRKLLYSGSFSRKVLAKLSFFFRLYRGLAGATISPRILASKTCRFWYILGNRDEHVPFRRRRNSGDLSPTYFPSHFGPRSRSPSPMSFGPTPPRDWADTDELDAAFRTIATLEVGEDLLLDDTQSETLMENVFAISVDDSLYIASPLLGDPTAGLSAQSEIRRVRGNVSRPGLTLLGFFSSRPSKIEFGEGDPSLSKVVNHHEYDGTLEDCFESTSLDIRLTGYVQDVARTDSSHFPVATFAEAVVSCRDEGRWVGDIDPMYDNDYRTYPGHFQVIRPEHGCRGFCKIGEALDTRLRAVENWEELLDPPAEPVVFKAHGNWQARLAATAICLQQGYYALLFGSHGCWDCAFEELHRVAPDIQLLPARRRRPSAGHGDDNDDGEKAWAQSLVNSFGGSRVVQPGEGIVKESKEPAFMEEDIHSTSETSSERRVDHINTPSHSPRLISKGEAADTEPRWLSLTDLEVLEEEQSVSGDSKSGGARSPNDSLLGRGRSGAYWGGGLGTSVSSRSSSKELKSRPVVFIL